MESIEHRSNKEVEKLLETDLKEGLTEEEAQRRILINGKNELPTKKTTPWWVIFLKSFTEPLQIILMIAAVISFIAPKIGSNWKFEAGDFIDFIVIITIVIIDAILETVQTVKASKSVDALKSLSKPTAIVLRDGMQKEIKASDLVIGDIVMLEAGKFVPAELRIIESSDFMVDESILTGESLPVNKTHKEIETTTILAEKQNITFMSTFTTAGRAVGVVFAIGLDTEIGKIAKAINENADEDTILEKKLSSFSYWISIFSVVVGIIIFVALILSGNKNSWDAYLLVAITLSIGIIPESLGAVVSITLSIATKRMAKENVIVKRLSSVETLGSVNVICTDKTGTLTQNKMTVEKVIMNNQILSSEQYIELNSSIQKDLFLKSLVLPNDSVTENDERIGDPTELALVDFAEKMNIDEQDMRDQFIRIDEIPFDSERKLMTTVNKIADKNIAFTKGAIDNLLTKCDQIMIDNKIVDFSLEMKELLINKSLELSDDALRVLAFGYKELNSNEELESGLIFIGAVAMIDPVRKEAVQAVDEAHAAGIRVIMITGDHKITALAIARDLDLALGEHEVISSEVLEKMTDSELLRVIDTISVFARVNPDHKTRIVNALQTKGFIVSMTGDGVNDAPSLSKADIGIAMGITGTDVAKQASDIILTDDNFGTIMKGVSEGRGVYQKIRRTIVLLMGFNLANVLGIFVLSLIIKMSPLAATNILFINLIVESCLAIAMGMGPNDITLMKKPPSVGSNSILQGLLLPIIKIGLIGGIISILSFYIGQSLGMSFESSHELYKFTLDSTPHDFKNWHDVLTSNWWTENNIDKESMEKFQENVIVFGRTSMFITMVISPLFYAHAIKLTNWKASKKIKITYSKPLIIASLIALLLELIVFFIPGVNDIIFKLMGYGSMGWNSKTIIILPVSIGLGLLIPMLILAINTMIFFSYHINLNPRKKNMIILQQMLENDRKEAAKKAKNKKNIKET